MDRAPFTPTEFAALRRGPPPVPLSPAHAAALRRAAELTVELTAVVASVRAHLAELEAGRAGPPEVEPSVATVAEAPASEPAADEGALAPGELGAAFAAARHAQPSRPRPRWADTLLGDA
jgi:hypothetical protein